MSGFALVLVLAALPAAGNLVGGLAADRVEISERTLSLALHLAAGIVLAVVGLELVPRGLASSAPWVPVVAFAAGGAAFVGIERAVDALRERLGAGEGSSGPLAIFTGVALDLFSDGVMIGTAGLIDPTSSVLLAIGQVPADVPEGFAAVATLRRAGFPRRTRVAMAASFTAPVLAGATIGWFALRGALELATVSVLALTGGVLSAVVVEEMIDEAHEAATSRLGPVSLTTGFALFAALSAYLG